MGKVIPWSWSGLEGYETCPKRFYETKIAKSVVETGGEHLVWGNEVHKAMELRISQGQPLPNNMIQWEGIAQQVVNAPGDKYCELKTAVNSVFEPVGFFDADVWNRGVEDVVIVNGRKALSIDWKTGKEKKFSRQLELSAARIMAKFPEVEEVGTAFAWLQTKKWTRATFVRSNLGTIWTGFVENVQDLLWSEHNNTWPAKPSGLCKRSRKPGSTYMGCPVTNCPHSENYIRGT